MMCNTILARWVRGLLLAVSAIVLLQPGSAWSVPVRSRIHVEEATGWVRHQLHVQWRHAPFSYWTTRVGPVPKPGQGDQHVILLHGLGGSAHDWQRNVDVRAQYQQCVLSGTAPAALLIAVSGDNGYWTDWKDGRHDYGKLVWRDLVADVARNQSGKSPQRVVVGVSMGAFGALSMALQHPEVFDAAIGLSATDMRLAVAVHPHPGAYEHVFGKPIDLALVGSSNPVDLVRSRAVHHGQRFVVGYGDAEVAKFKTGGDLLVAALRASGRKVETRVVSGGRHGWRMWSTLLPWAFGALGGRDQTRRHQTAADRAH